MSNNLRVVHGGLDAVGHDLARAVAQVDERLERLTAELAPLRSDWTGDAQQAYHHAKTVWDQAMTEMRDLLAQTQAAVIQADADYRAADARGAAAFQV
jgi:WXG100 family type VII secretion target